MSRRYGCAPRRPHRYGPEVVVPLVRLWQLSDGLCGKLLAAVMPDLLGALECHGELKVTPEMRGLLFQVSPATIDRRLRRHKRGGLLTAPRRQRPATTALKRQVPIFEALLPFR